MKKGMVQDIAFWAIAVFIFAVIIVIGSMLNTTFTEKYQASDAGTTAKGIQEKAADRFHGIMDNSFLFFFFIFGLSIVVVLYYVTSQPALFFVGLVLLVICMIPIGIIGNGFEEFQDNDAVGVEAAQMPILGWLMGHILEIAIGIGILGVVVLFSRVGGGY